MTQNDQRALATVSSAQLAEDTMFSPKQVDLIRQHLAPEATPDELMLFLQVASSRNLDPFRKHIYAVSRYDSRQKKMVTAHQVSIEGLRLIAERSGKYEGQAGPYWCDTDGVWREVWLGSEPPAAARVGVYKAGFREPLWGIARYDTFVQRTKEGNPTQFWKNMPEVMLAKVAEAAALRRAFPEEAGGVYVAEEMGTPDAIEVSGQVYDRSTGEARETPTQPHRERTQSDPPPRPSAEDVERKKAQQILGSIRQFGERNGGLDADVMDAVILDMTDAGSLRDLDIAALSKTYNDIQKKAKDDRDEFFAYADTVYRQMQGQAGVIDVQSELVAAGDPDRFTQ